MTQTLLKIPDELKPADGRFGSGPSRVRPAQLEHLAGDGAKLMGTSHRQKPVKQLVGAIRAGLRELFSAPRRLRGRARQRRHDGVLGCRDVLPGARARAASEPMESSPRSSRPARGRRRSWTNPRSIERRARRRARAGRDRGGDADVVAWAHNETSTGVMVPVIRPSGAGDALVLIDATSGAGGLPVDVSAGRRLLLRAPEGLCLRRRAVAGAAFPGGPRADRALVATRRTGGRWIPEFLSLTTALENSGKDQTYNTPAIATLFLLADQLEWMLELGRPRGDGGADDRILGPPVRVGRGSRARHAVRQRTRPSARWSWARSTSTTRSTRPRWRPRCAPTGSSTSSRTASSAATSCGSRCSRRPTRPTCGR